MVVASGDGVDFIEIGSGVGIDSFFDADSSSCMVRAEGWNKRWKVMNRGGGGHSCGRRILIPITSLSYQP